VSFAERKISPKKATKKPILAFGCLKNSIANKGKNQSHVILILRQPIAAKISFAVESKSP